MRVAAPWLVLLLAGCLDWDSFSRNAHSDGFQQPDASNGTNPDGSTAIDSGSGINTDAASAGACRGNLVTNGGFDKQGATDAWSAIPGPLNWAIDGHDSVGSVRVCGQSYTLSTRVGISKSLGGTFQLDVWLLSMESADVTARINEYSPSQTGPAGSLFKSSGPLGSGWTPINLQYTLLLSDSNELEIRLEVGGNNPPQSCFELDDVCLVQGV